MLQSPLGWNTQWLVLHQSRGEVGRRLIPLFYCLYIDDLVDILSVLGVGCHLKNLFLSILMYADDMALTSPSLRGLQKLLMATVGYVAKCKKKICFSLAKNGHWPCCNWIGRILSGSKKSHISASHSNPIHLFAAALMRRWNALTAAQITSSVLKADRLRLWCYNYSNLTVCLSLPTQLTKYKSVTLMNAGVYVSPTTPSFGKSLATTDGNPSPTPNLGRGGWEAQDQAS